MCRTKLNFLTPLLGVMILMFLVGCGTASSNTPQPLPPTSATAPVAANPTDSAAPEATYPGATSAATTVTEATAPAGGTPEASATGDAATPAGEATAANEFDNTDYLDNRSNAKTLLESFVNALNTKQYLRAYSYWNADRAQELAPFPEFEAGYAATEAVKLRVGSVSGSAGAGSFKFTVPVIMEVRTAADENQIFVGCYLLHLSNPGAQGTVPFEPLGIESAFVQEVDAGTDREARMETICEEGGYPSGIRLPAAATPDGKDISNQLYIDDRSDPVALLRSLFNAINSAQFVRAYSYWEPGAEELLPFDEFEAGYANTNAIQLVTDDTSSDAGAGQLFYSVPVMLTAENSDGATETFVGCYQLHLSQPAIQGTPPFQPLAIRSGSLESVAADTDADALLAEACQQ